MTAIAAALAKHQKRIAKIDAKILTIDIERLPGQAYFFDLRTDYIAPRNVVEWPRLLCFAARWYGQKRPVFEAEWIDRERMIEKSWALYDEADIVYTYNGKRFDNKHLKSDWLLAGMPPPRPWKDVDLYQVVKQFGFESKSLDSVTRRLGRPGKQLHYDPALAFRTVAGDKAAQADMKLYNVGDIELTEWLADRVRPYIHNHPIMGTLGDEKVCNRCNSTNLKLDETQRYRAVLIDFALYRCLDCGGNVKGGWHARAASTRGVQ